MWIEYKVMRLKHPEPITRVQEFKNFAHFKRYIRAEAFRDYWLVPNSMRVLPRKPEDGDYKTRAENIP